MDTFRNKANHLKRHGRRSTLTNEVVNKIYDLNLEGKTQREIASAVNVSQPTVNRVLSHNHYTYNDYETNTTSPKQRGTSSEYRQSRLDRDHPELAQRVKQGEITLASACKLANIGNPIIAQFQIKEYTQPQTLAKYMKEKLSPEFIKELITQLGGDDGESL